MSLQDESRSAIERLATVINEKPLFEASDAMGEMDLDPQAAFLLSRVDGTVTFAELIEISGLAEDEAAELLLGLLLKGVISFRQR